MSAKTKTFKATAAAGPAIAMLAVIVLLVYPQPRPSTLTPSAWSAVPGSTLRVDMDPVIGLRGRDAENLRMVLRPSQAQGPQSDLVLRIVEFMGAWFRVQIPQNARLDMGPCRLLLLDAPGDILATSGNRFFRVVSVGTKVSPKPTPGPDPRPGGESVRPKEKMTAPAASAEALEAQVMTTPGIAVQAKRLPIPVADYVTIGLNVVDIKHGIRYPLAFMLPSDFRRDDRVVLTYMLNAETGGIQNGLLIAINGSDVRSYDIHYAGTRAMSVVFHARILREGRNEIVLSHNKPGSLRLKVDEIVLWFHRDIAR
jgi:hypothetical protein